MDYPQFANRANRPDEIERQLDTRTRDRYTVTAIVSVYASSRFLPGLLDDLFGQTLYAKGELEIVFVDSHSPEDDWSLIEAAARDHQHVRAIRTIERETLYTAWNRAIAEAHGRYISNANTDDRHRNDAYELLAGVLDARPDVTLVYANSYVSRVENETFADNPGTEPFTTPAFFAPNQLLHFPFGAQPMWRTSVHDTIGVFDGSFKAAGDWDFAIRLAKHFRALHVEETLGSYLVGENTISFRDDTVTRENGLIHKRIHNPETAYAYYRNEGLTLETPQEKAQALVDLGVRALGYRIPYGTPKNKLSLAASFFAEATNLAPEWTVGWNNLAVALALGGQVERAKTVMDKLAAQTNHPTVKQNAEIITASVSGNASGGLSVLPSGLPFPSQDELQTSKVGEERSVKVVPPQAETNGHSQNGHTTNGHMFNGVVNPSRVSKLRREGIALLQSGNVAAGVAKLDTALEFEPFDTGVHDALRQLSLHVEPEWQTKRDMQIAEKIRTTEGEERLAWVHRSAQFQEGPESMTAIWDFVQGELHPQPPETDTDPQVTIVLTTHNHEQYFKDAFRSVIAQTFRNWELVIVDDNSTDDTPALIERLLAEHAEYRIKALRLSGVGPARARNTGVSQGSAPYLVLLDADDLIAADYIERLLPVLEEDESTGWVYPLSVQAGSFHRLWSWRPFDIAELAAADRMPVNSLIRREVFEDLGGFSPELVGAYEDWDLWLRAVRAGWQAQAVPEALFLYRKVAGSRCDFKGRPQAPEVDAKRTMILRVPEFYISGAANHHLLSEMLRIHPDLVDRWSCKRMERRFELDETPDHPDPRPELPVASDEQVTVYGTKTSATDSHLQSLPATHTNGAPKNSRPLRVLFFFFKNVHIPVMLPVFHEMQRQGGFEIAFAVKGYDRRIRAGMEPQELEILERQGVPILDDPQKWNADVSLMADNVAFHLFGCGKIVNIGHGLLSKGQYFTDTDMIHRENLEDLLCVPGDYHKQRLADSNRVFIPVVATGFPKLDRLFDADGPSRDDVMHSLNLDPAKRTILFAPTFNMALSSIPILWMRVAELVDENTYLLIKLHSSSLPEFKSAYRELAETHEHVIYAEDPDITNLLRAADVMLSDVSSVIMEFMALDKPVVLFDNPNQHTYRHYDPRDIEYAWRDVGIRTSTLDEVKAAIHRSFENPGEFSAKRRLYAEQLLADREGKAAGNVVRTIRDLLDKKYAPEIMRSDSTAVVLPVSAGKEQDAVRSVKRILDDSGEAATVFIVDHGCDQTELTAALTATMDRVRIVTPDELRSYKFESTYLALVQAGFDLGERRLFHLVNHLRREETIPAVAPLLFPRAAESAPDQNAAKFIKTDSTTLSDPVLLDRRARAAAVAKLVPRPIQAVPCVIAASNGSALTQTIVDRAASNTFDPVEGVRLTYDVTASRFIDNRADELNGQQHNGSNGNGTSTANRGRMRLVSHFENKGDVERALEHARKALEEQADDSEAQDAVNRLERALLQA